jgi:phosphoribosylformimino-5-aminoimidazole carboxamide ribonucleotide (ProFAR) isomerase
VLESVAELSVRVEAGGGLSAAGVDESLRHGASRAILGAGALFDRADPSVAIPPEEVVARYGERVGVAVDVRRGQVAPRGSGQTGPSVAEALGAVAAARPALVVYTDVDRDGQMGGPDLEALRSVVEAVGAPVLASGGIRSLDDLEALLALAPGVVGAIVGRALQEGSFSLGDGLALLAGEARDVID